MKSILLVTILLTRICFAQNDEFSADDMGRLTLSTLLSDKYADDMNDVSKNMLENKLNQIATQNGMGGDSPNPRFIITANVIQLNKEMTATAPAMVAMNLEVTIFIADNLAKTKFASTSVQVKGVGINETKAYMEALKNINPQNPNIKQFVDKGKSKIIAYYNAKCDFILKNAQSLVSQNKFEEAIFNLTLIPDVSKGCYDKAMDAVGPIYRKFMERNCVKLLLAAKTAFAASPDSIGAENARSSLAQIDPDAKCFNDAQKFADSVQAKVLRDQNRNWNFKMLRYKNSVEMQQQKIQAYKEVGVSYGNNQPKQQLIRSYSDPRDWLF